MLGRSAPLALATALLAAAPAHAVPDCAGAQPPRTILSGQGVLESVIAGDEALYFTDTDKDALMRLDAPDREPVEVASGIDKPGGLLRNADGTIVVGYGDGFQEGAVGNVMGQAGLVRVDPHTGSVTPIVAGLSMANGLARDPAGAIYASSDAGTAIDKVVGTEVQRGWSDVVSSNGLAIDSTATYLFANQTFQPAAIQRVELAHPDRVESYAAPASEDMSAGLDGLTIDERDRLFAAANGAGEVWRIDTDRSICALARGLLLPSAVAFGAGGAFPPESLYAVTFSGNVVEIPGVRPTAVSPAVELARLRVTLSPRAIRAGRTTTVAVTVRRVAGDQARREPGAEVRISNRRAVTGLNGRARLRVKAPRRAGRLAVRVVAANLAPARVRLRVLAR